MLALSLLGASIAGLQGMEAEAGWGCRSHYQSHPVSVVYPTVVHPVVRHETVVVHPVVTATVVVPAPVPVAPPAVVTPKAVQVPQGGTLRLKANFLGSEAGHVILASGSLTLDCKIVDWNPQFVVIKLPQLAVTKATEANLVISTKSGDVKRSVAVIINPTPDIEVIPTDEFVAKAPTEVLGR
jgi:hypothetical protein